MSSASFSDFLLSELWVAYGTARKGKRKTYDEHRFELNDMENIIALRDSIISRHYRPSRGVTFVVRDPVIREIVAAPFRDRIVHHFLYNICADWWDRRFIVDSYSCRIDKGTLFAQQRLAQHIRQVTLNYTRPAFAIALDIKSYFINLNHDKLVERLYWGLDRQFQRSVPSDQIPAGYFPRNQIRCRPSDRDELYQTVKFLWYQVIHDDPMRDIVIRGSRKDWKSLPLSKSLFNRRAGHGLVIGNLTSQLVSNIYLDQLDRFITLDLGYQHYGRYVDDFFILVPMPQKEQLLRDIAVIGHYLHDQLDLELHPYKQYKQNIEKGIPFVGSVVYPGFIIPSRRVRRKAFQAAYRLATTGGGSLEGLISREGNLLHINSRRFFKSLFDTFGWRYDWTDNPSPHHPPQSTS